MKHDFKPAPLLFSNKDLIPQFFIIYLYQQMRWAG